MEFKQIEDKIIEALKTDLPYLRTVETYAGQLADDIGSLPARFPAAFVVYGGSVLEHVDGPNMREQATFSVLLAARNLRSDEAARKGIGSEKGAYDLVADALSSLTNRNFGLDIEVMKPGKVSLIHVARGHALYGIDFTTGFDTAFAWQGA